MGTPQLKGNTLAYPSHDCRRRLIRKPEVLKKIGLGRTYLDDAVRDGRFPQPVRIGTTVCFVESEVDDWIDARIAERDSVAA